MRCPKCKSERAHRSRRSKLRERLASTFGFYPHACRQCSHTFFAYRELSKEGVPSPNPAVESEIQKTRSARAWKQRQRDYLLYAVALLLFAAILYFLTREPPAGV